MTLFFIFLIFRFLGVLPFYINFPPCGQTVSPKIRQFSIWPLRLQGYVHYVWEGIKEDSKLLTVLLTFYMIVDNWT